MLFWWFVGGLILGIIVGIFMGWRIGFNSGVITFFSMSLEGGITEAEWDRAINELKKKYDLEEK